MKYLLTLLFCLFLSPVYAEDEYELVCFVRVELTELGAGCSGTGFFIGPQKVLTAYHNISDVIEDGAAVRVEWNGTILNAKVSKHDKKSDLAILTVETDNEAFLVIEECVPIVGEKLTIIGHPRGRWARHRLCAKYVNHDKDETRFTCYYSIDKRVSVGMSGGPLVNARGKVVGLCSCIDNRKEYTRTYSVSLPVIRKFLLK